MRNLILGNIEYRIINNMMKKKMIYFFIYIVQLHIHTPNYTPNVNQYNIIHTSNGILLNKSHCFFIFILLTYSHKPKNSQHTCQFNFTILLA